MRTKFFNWWLKCKGGFVLWKVKKEQITLKGTCNQCGLCCFVPGLDGEILRCINLVVRGKPGEPMATKCGIYPSRSNGMSVLLIGKNGRIAGRTICAKDTPDETTNIIEKGIGKGCSLEIEEGK